MFQSNRSYPLTISRSQGFLQDAPGHSLALEQKVSLASVPLLVNMGAGHCTQRQSHLRKDNLRTFISSKAAKKKTDN